MTLTIKIHFTLPRTQAKTQFISVLLSKISGPSCLLEIQLRPGRSHSTLKAGRREQRNLPLEEPVYECLFWGRGARMGRVGVDISTAAREKQGSNHSKANSPSSHLLVRHALLSQTFRRIYLLGTVNTLSWKEIHNLSTLTFKTPPRCTVWTVIAHLYGKFYPGTCPTPLPSFPPPFLTSIHH